jgi:transcriptional regulator with XRE-family HTH domain
MPGPPTPSVVAFGRAIRLRRRIRDLTQETLAARAGISSNHLGEIERGRRDPRLTTALRLVEALELTRPERSMLWDEVLGEDES